MKVKSCKYYDGFLKTSRKAIIYSPGYLDIGVFPNSWRFQIVDTCPDFEQQKRHCPNKFRRISL